MNFKKSVLSTALVSAIGASAVVVPTTASAVPLFSGDWALTIAPTLTIAGSYTTSPTSFKIGKDGNWQSSFTFGTLPGGMSNGMTDTGFLVNGNGSSIANDGFAGVTQMNINATTGDISINGTTGQAFVGNLTNGTMSLTPNGRKGAINAPNIIADWNINDFDPNLCDTVGCTSNGNTAYSSFSTGSATAAKGTINGAAFVDAGDIDGDMINDYSGILVQASQVGSQWGSFFGATYYEAWRVNMLSNTAAISATGFNVDTIFATAGGDFAQFTAAVPVPAAVWLFGSGLMGLVGVARRKKA